MCELNTCFTTVSRIALGKGRILRQFLWAGCFLLVMSLVPVQAQEPSNPESTESNVTWESEVTVGRRYVWRGFLLNDSFSLQPAVSIGFKELTISSWSNMSQDVPFGQRWTEHDLTVDYTRGFDNGLSLSGGYINYAFPDLPADKFANEVYGAIGHEGPVSTSFGVYQNFGVSEGTYFLGSLSKEIATRRGLSLTPSFSVGYNREMFIPDSTFSDAVFGLSVTIPLGEHVTLSPSVNFSKSLDNIFFDDHWSGGLTFGWSY